LTIQDPHFLRKPPFYKPSRCRSTASSHSLTPPPFQLFGTECRATDVTLISFPCQRKRVVQFNKSQNSNDFRHPLFRKPPESLGDIRQQCIKAETLSLRLVILGSNLNSLQYSFLNAQNFLRRPFLCWGHPTENKKLLQGIYATRRTFSTKIIYRRSRLVLFHRLFGATAIPDVQERQNTRQSLLYSDSIHDLTTLYHSILLNTAGMAEDPEHPRSPKDDVGEETQKRLPRLTDVRLPLHLRL
jgi:hypothetical protein